jgi:hypothetical protein
MTPSCPTSGGQFKSGAIHLDIEIKDRGKDKRLTVEERRLLKRRQAIEPINGHLKADQRMDRCHLKGLG